MAEPKPVNQATLKKLRKHYVIEGLTPRAITAQMRMELARVQEIIGAYNLEAERELYLEQNPNLSAIAATSAELRRIQNKQQTGETITASERNFLMKIVEAEADGMLDNEQFQNWPKEKLDKRISELHTQLYPPAKPAISSQKSETDPAAKPESD